MYLALDIEYLPFLESDLDTIGISVRINAISRAIRHFRLSYDTSNIDICILCLHVNADVGSMREETSELLNADLVSHGSTSYVSTFRHVRASFEVV